MNYYLLKIATVIILLMISGCNNNDDAIVRSGKVSFSYKEADNGIIAGRTTQITPSFASFTLKKADGSTIIKEIAIHEFNGDYITQPEPLPSGQYTLEQFLILDSDRHTIYASPMEGSVLANLVSDPLPITINISVDEVTHVVPDVLELDGHTPEDFGYTSFEFNIVKTAAIRIPFSDVAPITEINLEFSNGDQVINYEIIPGNSLIDLKELNLLGKTWKTRILVWMQSEDCYPKVYRFKGDLTFNGSVIKLPELSHSSWANFYFNQFRGIQVFRSVHPEKFYQLEIQLQDGNPAFGYVDMTYWNIDGDQLSQTQYVIINGAGRIEVSFPLQQKPATLFAVDSFIALNTQLGIIQNLFEWEVNDNGDIHAVCH
ncbi:MAG: hypothetical protein HOP08_05685 [Cyclobacteriaceae bacterium]|nr:hypothetical protein [Cyclobacteriaceae bacterium]